jgi:hypothetical protein
MCSDGQRRESYGLVPCKATNKGGIDHHLIGTAGGDVEGKRTRGVDRSAEILREIRGKEGREEPREAQRLQEGHCSA